MPSSDRMCCEYVAVYGCVRVLVNVVVAVMVAVRDDRRTFHFAGAESSSRDHLPQRVSHARFDGVGLFVPKPSRGAGCQRCGMPDLGTTVRRRPLASTAGGGDCYSLGYSAPDGFGLTTWMQIIGALDCWPDSAARLECLWLSTRAIVHPRCTSCGASLTLRCQGSEDHGGQDVLL